MQKQLKHAVSVEEGGLGRVRIAAGKRGRVFV